MAVQYTGTTFLKTLPSSIALHMFVTLSRPVSSACTATHGLTRRLDVAQHLEDGHALAVTDALLSVAWSGSVAPGDT